MQFFSTIFAATALATIASAGSVHFVNQDSTQRTIIFTPSAGLESLPELVIKGSETANQTFPTGWIGNWYSVSDGEENNPGMLGEVRFDGFLGATYYDVSAIVNPNDVNGVKEIFPLHSNEPVSGCQTFPCSNAYNKWDDIATLSTDGGDLVCLLGTVSNERKRSLISKMSRNLVTN
ncbi:related to dnase1 protein [Rhynchosporium secalis]|uniref:Related to dnase1 protein n=1 Tax=Rhynchosporium secalis TaxID=38038 RepID=A0A1E1MK28_RHYSE|nr:related to dnase1 protein [Rhynchosporium secalis]